MKKALQILYSCDKCGLKDVKVNVPAREDEEIKVWMDQTGERLSRDHDARSPFCFITSLSQVKIPLASDSQKIGEAISAKSN